MSEQQTFRAETDEELVRLYRNGSQEAAGVLMDKYKPLVLRLSKARFLVGGERDDLLQEGMIGLFKALRDYDEEKAASFATFAALCIDRQMLHAIEASQRDKNKLLNDAVYLTDEEWEYAIQNVRESPEMILVRKEMTDERLHHLRDMLSPLEKRVLSLLISGMSTREISVKLGRSAKSIDNAVQRIRKKSSFEE
ncbi:MAG: sigma-70 family RNA polymerase sigma factor [Lachnospiraceae bacterium]|nr:sigma-70 family RNA polymerase sigma factor [Lachnospiraceae bacterium]